MLHRNIALQRYGFNENDTTVEKPGFTKPYWWDDIEFDSYKAVHDLRLIIKGFIEGSLVRATARSNTSGRHKYYTKNNGTELWLFKDNPSLKIRICVAKKIGGTFIGNASSIQASSYLTGNRKRRKINWLDGQQRVQEILSEVMPMVPFRMFKENRFDINTMQIIDRGPEESIKIRKRKQHFMGAMLFSLGIRNRSKGLLGKDKEHFLFDIDRNDLALNVFNPFLSKLGRECTSIADAYDSLKPQEVKDAERFLNKSCPRQGEWFFIPVVGEFEPARARSWDGKETLQHAQATLQSKGNRPHYVTKLSKDGYVKGKVTHGGYEHLPIQLDSWHKPVPNSAIESFTVTGGID